MGLMTRAHDTKPQAKAVAVSFAALDGDPYPRVRQTGRYVHGPSADPAQWGPTLRAVADPRSELFGRLSDWYYLCHPVVTAGAREVGRAAREVAEDTRQAITAHVPPEARPRFHVVTWETDRPPHDHADLWRVVKEELRRVRERHSAAEIVIVLSSGTAAMHAILFLAGSVGLVDGPIRLVQVERGEGARLRAEKPIVDVTLKIETVLQIARETVPVNPGADATPGFEYDKAKSPALQRALEDARRAARVPFPILLRGERGVGKSTLAALIRAWSPFRKPARDREWPAVACGQFTDPGRLMVELCGSVKGAFTGAETREGLLALADHDTLFLDEIHDMSEANQRLMIRLLEDGVYYPMGSPRPRTSRFRLITGTNRPDAVLHACLAPDFYDRIRDLEIEVPPLRECREDLPWMWEAAWGQVAFRAGLDAKELDGHHERVVEALHGDPLPGNWRDLRRLAVRLAVHVHAEGRPTPKAVQSLLSAFFPHPAERGGAAPVRVRSAGGPRLLLKREQDQLRRLEEQLGPNLERLWEACEGGAAPRLALVHLLGDRHRAVRAEKFIPKIFPEQWATFSRSSITRT
jgi:DNA-binding NtrC family response regulator